GKEAIEVESAGTSASGVVHPTAVSVMKEKGIDISLQHSKQFKDNMLFGAHIVVTLGCCTASALCPVAFKGKKIDWEIQDPIGMPLDFYRGVRDEIEERVKGLLNAEGLI
ncbi:MAG: hypothetical protein HY889_09395, partial [Deltaproteobacteria bacterium]|nr:hypothetical protein [Deltaproteobacteria bacterium]